MVRFSLTLSAVIGLAVLLSFSAGCQSRARAVKRADRDAYCLIQQKTASTPWAEPVGYSITPPEESRLFDPCSELNPRLPVPSPSLYAYQLPYLQSQQEQQAQNAAEDSANGTQEDSETPLGSPIPPDAWNAIPAACLERMFEFESVRDEAKYTRETYQDAALDETPDETNRLTLNQIVDLALLNSRNYQTQKETLYEVSLQLSLERFAYQTKFNRTGNGTSLNYSHQRNGGTSVDVLSIPTGVGIERMLVTGGDLMARFANDILLTFNGPSGFTANVSSDILIEFAQPLLQKDIRFEPLTQAERNLVYAARDFARFRKQFFVDFASEYYDLIRGFRGIEIESQNYFSLVRAFNQAEAEYQAGLVPRFQVDQVEQDLLGGKRSLIGVCNSLDQNLDGLKLSMGIPTETPINVNLTELNELTRLDQLSVSADLTSRVLSRLETSLRDPDRAELVSTAAVLLDRILEASELAAVDGEPSQEVTESKRLRARFLVDYSRLTSQQLLFDLQSEIQSESPSLPVIFQRSQAHSEALLNLVERQLDLARLNEQHAESTAAIKQFEETQLELTNSVRALRNELQRMIEQEQVEELQTLVNSSSVLRGRLGELVADIDRLNGFAIESDPQADLARIVNEVQQLMKKTTETLNSSSFGLKPIEIDMDNAMITALVLRFDLMNQRGVLADNWREIKLAADELKSVINFDASHRISTPPGANQPFNFSFDDSSTSMRLSVDAPLNRFAERNGYRRSLINYQRALRALTQLEDSIKFSVRNDLRNLVLQREQYLIDVASAALAYERVVSTSLEFRLGTGGVSARDFLEAQRAYTQSLSRVATSHIAYIVERTQLFLDLELLQVNENGFWEEINEEEYQPQSYFEIPPWAHPVYGELPAVRYSKEIKQMLCIPPGVPEIIGELQLAPETESPVSE